MVEDAAKKWKELIKNELKKRGVDKDIKDWFHSVTYCIQAGGYKIQDFDIKMIKLFMDKKYNDIIEFAELQEFENRPFKQLSSGMKSRLAFSIACLVKPDILLLDEPTNHLDIAAIEWLENYVKHYPFAVVLVSHDRMFLDHVVDEIVEIEFGKTQRYVS